MRVFPWHYAVGLAVLVGVGSVALRPYLDPSGLRLAPLQANIGTPGTAAAQRILLPPPSLVFEHNAGQADARVQFVARGSGYAMRFAPLETSITLRRSGQLAGLSIGLLIDRWLARGAPQSATIRMSLVGVQSTSWQGERVLAGRSHYLLGNDPARWITGIPQFERIRASGVYTGIDLVFHGNGGELEYDFHVAPGANPASIAWRIHGASAVGIETDGGARIRTAVGDIHVRRPVAWQLDAAGVRQPVVARLVLRDKRDLAFNLGDFDRGRELVIDPVISYGALFGGSDNSTIALGMTTDAAGAILVSGTTCSLQYPVVAGSLQSQGGEVFGYDPCEDAFISKLDATGRSLLFSTFLGGTDRDAAARIAIDASGAVYVTGITLSNDFPTTANAPQRVLNGAPNCRLARNTIFICADAFISKLSADGSSLLYSTLLGGSRFDFGVGLALDSAGAAYVQGWSNSTDFPTTAGALQRVYGGGTCFAGITPCYDAFVAKLAPDGGALSYSTYLGGNDQEYASGIVVDTGGNAYLTGNTVSQNFPTTAGTVRSAHTAGSQPDGYVVKLNPGGSALVWSTLLGGSAIDAPYDLALDPSNGVTVVGTTDSADFPATAGAYRTTAPGGPAGPCDLEDLELIICGDAFVSRLNADATALVFSSYLGGSGLDAAYGVARDAAGDYWVGGETRSPNFPTTADSINSPNAAPGGFVAQLAADGATLRFSTQLRSDTVVALRTGATGEVYGAGTGLRSPTTPGAYVSDPSHYGAYAFKLAAGTAPRLTVTPSSQNVNAAIGGTSAPKAFTITNVSAVTADLRVSDVTASGSTTTADDFVATDDCPSQLAAGATCTATARLRPSTAGNKSGALRILGNAIDAPQTLSVGGNAGLVLAGAFAPGSLVFTDQAPGTQSAVLAASLANSGVIGATNRGFTTTGPNADDFVFDTINCQPDSFCTLNVRFAPMAGANGPRTATVSLESDTANSPNLLQLSGTANSGAAATLSTTALDFGAVRTSGGDTLQVRLSNGGGAALANVAAALGGADYSFAFNGCNVASLASQASCIMNVTLSPMSTGVRTGTLTITHASPPASPQTVTLSGLGADPAGPIDRGFQSGRPDFVPVVVGSVSDSTFNLSVQNLGGASLTGLTVATTGDFTQTSDCSATVTVNNSCTIQVKFAPTAEGLRTGTVRVESNAPGSPRVANLTGTGIRLAGARLTPANVDFGPLGVGRTSSSQPFTLTNTGAVALTIASIGVTAPFAQSNDCGASLVAGASCTIAATFAPAAAGPASRALRVVSNAPGHEHTAGLRGSGTTANALVANPRRFDFGNQAVGGASAPRIVTISNTGNGAITLRGIVAPRYYTQSNDCTATLAPGASCTASVRFVPLKVSPLSTIGVDAPLSIAGNFDGSPVLVALTGVGINAGPVRTLSPASVAFGTVAVGSSTTADLRVGNSGTTAMAISSALIGGANATDFAFVAPAAGTSDCRSVASLAAGMSCVLRVQFSPTTAGGKLATVTVTDNAAGSPAVVTISGTATGSTSGSVATLSAMSVAVGTASVGGSVSAPAVTLSNGGTAALVISAFALGGTDAAQFAQTNTCGALPATLAAGASCAITLVFSPTAAGARSASLGITTNAPGSPQTIALSGTAVDFAIAATAASTSVAAGQTASIPLNLTTNGPLAANLTLSASGNPVGTTVSFNPSSFAAGSTGGTTTMSIATASRTALQLPTPAGGAASPGLEGGAGVQLASMGPGVAWLGLCALPGLWLAGRRRRGLRPALLALLLLPWLAVACSSGGGGNGTGGGSGGSGTPAGSYTITVTATSGTVTRTSTVTLTVT